MEQKDDKFEISFRLLGNELIALQLFSSSNTKNWVMFGLLALVLMSALIANMVPVFIQLAQLF